MEKSLISCSIQLTKIYRPLLSTPQNSPLILKCLAKTLKAQILELNTFVALSPIRVLLHQLVRFSLAHELYIIAYSSAQELCIDSSIRACAFFPSFCSLALELHNVPCVFCSGIIPLFPVFGSYIVSILWHMYYTLLPVFWHRVRDILLPALAYIHLIGVVTDRGVILVQRSCLLPLKFKEHSCRLLKQSHLLK